MEQPDRRGFLRALGGGFAAFALDPERALWVPGKKLISIAAPRVAKADWIPLTSQVSVGDIVKIGGLPHEYREYRVTAVSQSSAFFGLSDAEMARLSRKERYWGQRFAIIHDLSPEARYRSAFPPSP
jgi:hypothetical protein